MARFVHPLEAVFKKSLSTLKNIRMSGIVTNGSGGEVSAEVRYDRQVRLWGAAAQQAIQRTCISFAHTPQDLPGLCSEMAKIFILAGVRRVSFDGGAKGPAVTSSTPVTAFTSNFFLRFPAKDASSSDKCSTLTSLQQLNPLVDVVCGPDSHQGDSPVSIEQVNVMDVVAKLARVGDVARGGTGDVIVGLKRPRADTPDETQPGPSETSDKQIPRTRLAILQVGNLTVCQEEKGEGTSFDAAAVLAAWARAALNPSTSGTPKCGTEGLQALLSLPTAAKLIALILNVVRELTANRSVSREQVQLTLLKLEYATLQRAAPPSSGITLPANTWLSNEERDRIVDTCLGILGCTGRDDDAPASASIIDNSIAGSVISQQVLNLVSGVASGQQQPSTTLLALVTSGTAIVANR